MNSLLGWIRFGTGGLILSFVLYPIAYRLGWRRESAVRTFQTLAAVALVLMHGAAVFGWWAALGIVAIGMSVGTAAEAIGIRYGWVFGRYRYSDRVGPLGFGFIPLFAPLLWSVLPYLGFFTAESILTVLSGGAWSDAGGPCLARDSASVLRMVEQAVIGSLTVTAIDAVAEPIAVGEGRWFWTDGGRYFGIPISNFLGWFLTSLLILALWFLVIPSPPVSTRIPADILLLPTFGFGLFFLVCANVCFEKKLHLPGWIGAVSGLIIFLVGFLAFFSYHF